MFSPDGKWVVTASAEGTARVWEAATGKPVVTFQGDMDQLFQAAYSPDGKLIVTASTGETAHIFQCESCGSIDELLELAKRRLGDSGRPRLSGEKAILLTLYQAALHHRHNGLGTSAVAVSRTIWFLNTSIDPLTPRYPADLATPFPRGFVDTPPTILIMSHVCHHVRHRSHVPDHVCDPWWASMPDLATATDLATESAIPIDIATTTDRVTMAGCTAQEGAIRGHAHVVVPPVHSPRIWTSWTGHGEYIPDALAIVLTRHIDLAI